MFQKKYLGIVACIVAMITVSSSVFADESTVPTPITSSDGKHSAIILIKDDGVKKIVLDGKELTYTNFDQDSLYFDGKNQLVFVLLADKKREYVINGKSENVLCDDLGGISPTSDNSVASYTCGNDGKYEIHFIGGKTYGPFSYVPYPTYSLNSDLFGYQVSVDDSYTKNYFIFSDGREVGKDLDSATSLQFFGKNGNLPLYVAQKNGKQYVVANGKMEKIYDEVSYLSVSPDGKRYGYVAKKGEKYLFIMNGRIVKSGILEFGSWYYSGTKKLLILTYRNASGWIISVGGKEYGPYANTSNPWINFNEDDSIWTVFVNNGKENGVLMNGKFIIP